MVGILGGPPQGGILGLLQQGQQGAPPAYGSDAWALQTGGPGALIWREMMRAMASNKGGHPLGFMDPKVGAFSPELAALLGPRFQNQGK